MSPAELQNLLSKEEHLKLDFKREFKLDDTPPGSTPKELWAQYIQGQWDELIKDIIALANGNVGTAGKDGILIIGADDKLQPDGTRLTYDTNHLKITGEQVLSRVNEACTPPIPNLSCERVETEGKVLLVITIHPSPYLHETSRQLRITEGTFDKDGTLRHVKSDKRTYSARTAFVRRGESIFPATDDERRGIANEKAMNRQSKAAHIELDRELFREIREILKSDGVISYVREASFDGAFEREPLKELATFKELCKRPESEFMDEDMEALKQKLLDAIQAFWRAIGQHTTWDKYDPAWSRMALDPWQEPNTLERLKKQAATDEEFNKLVEDEQKKLRRIAKELNQLADQVCAVYDEFIRAGRRKLAV